MKVPQMRILEAPLTIWETTEKGFSVQVLLLPSFELLRNRIVSGLEKYVFLMEKKSVKMLEFNEPCPVFS